jgi:type I restriction enzyme M protein
VISGEHISRRTVDPRQNVVTAPLAEAAVRSYVILVDYEIGFTRYFYKPQPMRSVEEIRADILALVLRLR